VRCVAYEFGASGVFPQAVFGCRRHVAKSYPQKRMIALD
jgi:hypothetical protein